MLEAPLLFDRAASVRLIYLVRKPPHGSMQHAGADVGCREIVCERVPTSASDDVPNLMGTCDVDVTWMNYALQQPCLWRACSVVTLLLVRFAGCCVEPATREQYSRADALCAVARAGVTVRPCGLAVRVQ